MSTTPLQHEVREFFDAFVAAFREFDGPLVAQRYATPCMSVDAQGKLRSFRTRAEIADYFQSVLAAYREQGCRSCRFSDPEVVAMGCNSTLATVTWELLRGDGSILTTWRESYHLVRTGDGLRIATSTDHAG